MNPSRPLKMALFTNATFSISCGFALLLTPDKIGELLGIQADLIYRLLGLGLMIFAADLLHQVSTSPVTRWRAILACEGDFAWVVATVAGLLLFPGILSQSGFIAVSAVGFIVFGLGLWQVAGLWYLQKNPSV